MSRFTAIDLSKLPHPEVIKIVGFEVLLEEMKAHAIGVAPELATFLALESEPSTKLLQDMAYHRALDRSEFNDGAKAVMPALSTGTNLDNLAAYWSVERLVVQEADDTVSPPLPKILEGDEEFRTRMQLSLEGHTTAGSRASYVYWGLSASAQVKDVDAYSTNPGDTIVTILTHDNTGLADQALLNAITGVFEGVRPLCANVTVQSAEIIPLTIEAVITVYEGPGASAVLTAAKDALVQYLDDHHRLGHDITISGIHAALHVDGAVHNVNLSSPANDVIITGTQAAYCDIETDMLVTLGGVDV